MSIAFKKRTSIFTKLFFVFIFAGIGISVITEMGHRLTPPPGFSPRASAIVESFARDSMDELGAPPEFKEGLEFAERYGVSLRIEGPNYTWSSSDELPAIDSLPAASPGMGPPPGGGWHHWVPFFLHPLVRHFTEGKRSGASLPARRLGQYFKFTHEFASGPAKVLFVGPRRPFMEPPQSIIWAQLFAILLVIALSYFVVRWILNPLAELNDGVQALAEGKLHYRVPVKRSDELGYLASAFNAMAVRVREMIDSKQQLLIDVSHELRSPLTRARLNLELMDKSDHHAHLSHDLIELEVMVNSLLETARHESGHGSIARDTSDLVLLTKEVVNSYADLGKPVAITEHPETLSARVDPERIKGVLRNLIENALKYSPDGKSVSISLTTQAQRAKWEIRDEGVGIPSEELEKVFQPFYRVDKSRTRKTGGFGLGLSLCKRIVEAHGGTIHLESTLERGTSAIIAIPL